MGTGERKISGGDDVIGRSARNIFQNRLASRQVAVDVRQNRHPHRPPILPARMGWQGYLYPRNALTRRHSAPRVWRFLRALLQMDVKIGEIAQGLEPHERISVRP